METRYGTKEKPTTKVTVRSRNRDDLRARRNAESTLFRLPLELRNRIYEFVCGGETIHVEEKEQGLLRYFCSATLSEEEAQKKFDTSDAPWYAPETADRHRHCCTHWSSNHICTSTLFRYKPRAESLEVNILRCCRQVYQEAKFVPYRSNNFFFREAATLIRFCSQVPEQCRNMIRRLHVELSDNFEDIYDPNLWRTAFRTVATSLPGLQRFYIAIELCPSDDLPRDEQATPIEKLLFSQVLQVGQLSLRTVTVVICDKHFLDGWLRLNLPTEEIEQLQTEERWTLAQKQKWSRYLRDALLHYEDRYSIFAKLKREAREQGRIFRLLGDLPSQLS